MTPITAYFLARLPSGNVQVNVFGGGYASYQCYANNALLDESTQQVFVVSYPPNSKIDILGLSSGEAGTDFSDQLADEYGDKVEFILPYDYLGSAVKVYFDNQTGVIDYGRPLAFAIANELVGTEGWDEFSASEWFTFSASDWNSFEAEETDQVKLTITPRLKVGTYKFALVSYSNTANAQPYLISQTITTRPDEISPFIADYDSAADVLTIGTDDDGIGTYSLYAADWGQPETSINFTTPILSSSTSPVVVMSARGHHSNATRYFAVRKTVDGVEEKNFNAFAFTLIENEWAGNYPDPPVNLRAQYNYEGVELTWQYQVGRAAPDGFHVYVQSIADAEVTVPFTGSGTYTESFSADDRTTFTVRAYRGSLEEQNTNTVTIAADNGPEMVTGSAVETWRAE